MFYAFGKFIARGCSLIIINVNLIIFAIKKARRDTKKYHDLSVGDRKIYLIQRGTKTSFKPLVKFHNDYRLRHNWYYRWHCHPHHKKVHWAIVLLFLVIALVSIHDHFISYKKTTASGDEIIPVGTAQIDITIPQQPKTISGNLFGNNLIWQGFDYLAVNKEKPELGLKPEFEDKLEALHVSMMRLNSGEGVYRWFQAVGPIADRPEMNDNGNMRRGYFGTDEYLAENEKLGVKDILISVNYAGGLMTYNADTKAMVGTYAPADDLKSGAQEATNWVEYCNGIVPSGTDTSGWALPLKTDLNWGTWGAEKKAPGYFAWLRAQPTYGKHPEPYGVKYWEIGNEVYWADRNLVGFAGTDNGATNYSNDVVTFSRMMKAIDPTIKIGLVTVEATSYTNWNDTVISGSVGAVDFLSIHMYSTLQNMDFVRMYSGTFPPPPERQITVPADGTYQFDILARGQPANNGSETVYPQLEMKIDGEVVKIWDVGFDLQKLEYSDSDSDSASHSQLTAGDHTVVLTFINNGGSILPGEDRNLFLYRATFNGEDFLYPKDTEQQWLFYDRTIKNAVLDNIKDKIAQYSPDHPIEMMITEGGLNIGSSLLSYNDLTSNKILTSDADPYGNQNGAPSAAPMYAHRMSSALYLSMFLNTLILRDDVSAYLHWNIIDSGYYGIIRYYIRTWGSTIKTNQDGTPFVSTTPVYDLLKLYQKYSGWSVLDTAISSPEYSWPTKANGVTPLPMPNTVNEYLTKYLSGGSANISPSGVKYIDAISTLSADQNKLAVILTNRSSEDISTTINVSGYKAIGSATAKQLKVISLGNLNDLSDPAKMLRNYDPNFDAHNETEPVNNFYNRSQTIVSDNVGVQDVSVTTSATGVPKILLPADSVTTIELLAASTPDIVDPIIPPVAPPTLNLSSDNYSTSWNMVSFPDMGGNITDDSLIPGTFKIRRFDGGSNSYKKGEDENMALIPGLGYWLKIDDVNKITGLKYVLDQKSSTEISVTKGWNLLGNPFQSDLPLSNLQVKYKDGSTRSFEEAILRKEVAGYAWSWESTANPKQYYFIAINPERYKTAAAKKTFISPFRGFWMIVKSDQISSILMNK